MDGHTPDPRSFQALLNPREAMTIAVRVQVSPSIVDTRIVAATARAAELFGYTTPAALEGQFTSMVHCLEDIQRTRLRSTLRALGLEAPTDHYEIRLLHSSGQTRRVRKHVEQRQINETMVWICRHEPVSEHHPFMPPLIPPSVPEEAVHQLFGWACVAEVEAMLRQQRLLLTNIQPLSIFSPIQDDRSAGRALEGPTDRPVERVVVASPWAYYRCRCLVCDREWITRGEDSRTAATFVPPTRCNYPDCRSYAWQDPIAAPAARRKRLQRRARHRTRLP